MKRTVNSGFKAVIDQAIRRRQDYLAGLKSGSSMIKITYQGKQLTCVYMRHTMTTVSVSTCREIVDHLWNGGTLCLAGSFNEIIVKFQLAEIQITNG